MMTVHEAAKQGNLAELEKEIKLGHKDLPDDSGYTPLMYAVSAKQLGALDLLIQNEADPNLQKNDSQLTALMIAVMNDYIEGIKKLLSYERTDPECENFKGNTAVMLATLKNNLEMVQLLAPRSNVDHVNYDGETAFQFTKDPDIIDCLILSRP